MTKNEISEILARPYARLVIPDIDGTVAAEIVEFPGCVASGNNAAEALASLDEVAADWINEALEQGQDIPEPMNAAGYSGKLVLRMPKSLHQRSALYAERDGVSLNQFIVTCVAEHVGERARMRLQAVQPTQTFHIPVLALTSIAVGHFPYATVASGVGPQSASLASGTGYIATQNERERIRA